MGSPAFKTRARVRFENVDKWRGCHEGSTAVLLGNGPSLYELASVDKLRELQKFNVMIGMNRSWMLPSGEKGYVAPYHVIFGELHGVEAVLGRYKPEFIFTNKSCLKSLVGYNGQVFAVDNRGDWRADAFDWNIKRGTGAPFAGMYALQLCAWFGIKEIWLCGYDMGIRAHHYNNESDGFDRSTHVRHFDGVRTWANATGIKIYNTNPESAVYQFEYRPLPD